MSARSLLLFLSLVWIAGAARLASALPANPIVFVAQVPIPSDFGTVNATFGNHLGSVAVRAFSDLYIRYPDGTLRNLTGVAGYGNSGMQGANSIAVRDPAVHWNGSKILFSMVIGAPTQRYQVNEYYWQIFEATNIGIDQTPVITKVPNQPQNFNNVMPTYASDGTTIIFASDRPRNGARHLYPQRDEYESAPTNTGLWSLAPSTGTLLLLDHSPSGDFNPSIDSFGRVVFTRWDHLQRDQQADNEAGVLKGYGAFNYSDESATAARLDSIAEYFPEHEDTEAAAQEHPNINEHRFNQFFPWAMNQDGTELETINHIGRHELHGYIPKSFKLDSSLEDYYGQFTRVNPNPIQNLHQIREDPTVPGKYFGIDCPEFGTHAAGQVVSLLAPPTTIASQITATYVTSRVTSATSDNPGPLHTGLYRNPLPLSDGTLVVSHTSTTAQDANIGSSTAPQSKYSFRLKPLVSNSDGFMRAGAALTSGINKSVSYWSPDELVSYSGELWELSPVEVVARTPPSPRTPQLESPETSVFTQTATDIAALKAFLVQNDLALIVGRNVTTRDSLDLQQPFNLKIANGVQTISTSGTIYTLKYLQLFQGDQIRGYGSSSTSGRRVLAVPLHDAMNFNVTDASGPTGNVILGSDGSFSAFVPARRALTWQLTDAQANPVIRERYWVTFQPGEIRVCSSCHGITSHDQAGHAAPTNAPGALADLLRTISGLPTPTPTSAPTPGAGGPRSSFTLSVSSGVARLDSKRFKIQLTRASQTSSISVKLRVLIRGKACQHLEKRVALKTRNVVTAELTIPLSTRAFSARVEAAASGETPQTADLTLPKSRRRASRSPAALCTGASFRLRSAE